VKSLIMLTDFTKWFKNWTAVPHTRRKYCR